MTIRNNVLQSRFPVGKGDVVEAGYSDTGIHFYQNNPLIEALPAILSVDQVTDRLSFYPFYDLEERLTPAHHRLHLIQSALNFFAGLPVHLDLE